MLRMIQPNGRFALPAMVRWIEMGGRGARPCGLRLEESVVQCSASNFSPKGRFAGFRDQKETNLQEICFFFNLISGREGVVLPTIPPWQAPSEQCPSIARLRRRARIGGGKRETGIKTVFSTVCSGS